MYYLSAIVAAVLIAFMVVTNGQLSDYYDSYLATIIIHATGLVAISIVALCKKVKLFNQGIPFFLYTGGAIGVASTLFTNLSYGKISITAIIALSLFAQTVTSLLIDQFGWFGMPIKKINLPKVAGLIFTMIGIIYLMRGAQFNWVAVLLSLCTGITIVVSRYVNAILAEKTNVIVGTWYNFLIGLIVSILIWLATMAMGKTNPIQFGISSRFWIYSGGLLGGCVVALSCICAKKISAVILTLIMFVGQLFTGVFLDYLIAHVFSLQILIGGFLTTAGLLISLLPHNKRNTNQNRY